VTATALALIPMETMEMAAHARQGVTSGRGRPVLAWRTAYGDRGYWCVAGSPAMNQALPNAALQRLGFQSLLERYHSLATH